MRQEQPDQPAVDATAPQRVQQPAEAAAAAVQARLPAAPGEAGRPRDGAPLPVSLLPSAAAEMPSADRRLVNGRMPDFNLVDAVADVDVDALPLPRRIALLQLCARYVGVPLETAAAAAAGAAAGGEAAPAAAAAVSMQGGLPGRLSAERRRALLNRSIRVLSNSQVTRRTAPRALLCLSICTDGTHEPPALFTYPVAVANGMFTFVKSLKILCRLSLRMRIGTVTWRSCWRRQRLVRGHQRLRSLLRQRQGHLPRDSHRGWLPRRRRRLSPGSRQRSRHQQQHQQRRQLACVKKRSCRQGAAACGRSMTAAQTRHRDSSVWRSHGTLRRHCQRWGRALQLAALGRHAPSHSRQAGSSHRLRPRATCTRTISHTKTRLQATLRVSGGRLGAAAGRKPCRRMRSSMTRSWTSSRACDRQRG